jgi:hypothetical protein
MFPCIDSMLQNGMLQNISLQKRYVQNSSVLQNGTVTKRYIVINSTCYKTVRYKTVVTKRYPEKMVFYITVQYSHNQQGSTSPWIGWALSLT